jgi:outer membrane protein assembly factor BamA
LKDGISDRVEALNPMYFGPDITQLRYFRFDYVFNHDQRDSKVYPLKGNAYKVKLQRTGLGIVKDFTYKNWELEAAVFYHRHLANRIYFTNAFKGKISTLKDAPYYFSNALGYSEFMTSYEYYVINGTDYFLNKFISKFEIVKPREFTIPYLNVRQFSRVHYAIYLNLLADVGYVYQHIPDPSNFMANELQYSAGIGLDIVTYYDQILRLEYSVNRYGIAGFFVHVETPFFRW